MNKKILYVIVGIIILGVAYWLISPLWRNVSLDEQSPLDSSSNQSGIEGMNEKTKQEFTEAMDKMKDEVVKMEEEMPTGSPKVLRQGQLVASAHEVAGKVLLIDSGDGNQIVRFEDFKSVNGPDLRIYLSTDLDASDYVDLGVMRATEGNVNYAVPAGTDTSKYKYVLVWCRAFSVLFSYGELK